MIFLLFIICGIQRESLFFIYRFFTYILFLYNAFSYIYNKIDIIKIIFFLFFCENEATAAARSANRRESHSLIFFVRQSTNCLCNQSITLCECFKAPSKKSLIILSRVYIISARIWTEQEETDSVYNEKFYCDKKIYFVILLNRVVMTKGLQ